MIAKLTSPSIARAAILPVAGVLAVITGLALVFLVGHNRAKTTASLVEKAVLTARVIAPNAAMAVWRFDTQSGSRILQSLGSDPDFASGILVDDKGEVFARFRNSGTAVDALTPVDVASRLGVADPKTVKISELSEFVGTSETTIVAPLIIDNNGNVNIGYMALSFSSERASAAARREMLAIGCGGALSLIAVCALLAWILSHVTHPIRDMTRAMNRLSSGEHDTPIPARDRRDEIGAMARALAVFKENSIERQRLEFLTRSLRQTTEELRREGEKVAHLASHDTMTGLLNRASFTDKLNGAFAAAEETGAPFAVCCLDLDHFKDVNDTLGHQIGDLLLRRATERLQNVVRDDDIIGRLGGDEFAVLVSSMITNDVIAGIARRMNEVLAEPFELEGNEVHVSGSIGISVYVPGIASPDEMMIQADLALYRVKQRGRNDFCFHSPDLDLQVHERVSITADLHAALSRDELELYYQPQVEISSGRIVGVEALVRWNHPGRGLLSPRVFIPVAETTGMIVPLGRWILEECCRQIRRWNDEGVVPRIVAINVSAAQFKACPNLDNELSQLLARYDVDPRVVELELTEHTLMETTETHGCLIDRLGALGVGIAIDDFGTGYSSLAYLRSRRVSRLKIAQQFVGEITTNPSDAAIVKATIGLARELGIDVVAEGVERAEQMLLLQLWGCRCAQGYYFSRPVPTSAATALLRRGVVDLSDGTLQGDGRASPVDDASAA